MEDNELTPGERVIMKKLGDMEARLRMVETPQNQIDRTKSNPPKTQVNSDEPGSPVLVETEDGFLYWAPEGYEGPICNHCHMPPLLYCDNGVVGVDHATREIQMDPDGKKTAHIACPQKKKWRNIYEPLIKFSRGETLVAPPALSV